MRILFINSVCGIRSTGRIVTDLAEQYMAKGHECKIAYGRETVPQKYQAISYRIGSETQVKINALKARLYDNEGLNAHKATRAFLAWAENYNPDLLWLHNIHGYYLNFELLFDWIKSRPQMEVRWTLHDCWAFTGHCAHFSYVSCDKWKSGCEKCPQTAEYPKSILRDHSFENYSRKKKAFCGVHHMTLITPSGWLADLVGKSFLKEYPIEVVHNTIDTVAFRPIDSDFRKAYALEDKKIVLGVASAWSERKGLSDFVKLAALLDDQYAIVLVGLSDKQKKAMPKNILCLECTNSKEELAKIYTASDVFLNLSKEETFGLTILEALACGSYSVVYKGTACEEVVMSYGGIAVEQAIESVVAALGEAIAYSDARKRETQT